MIIVAVSSLIRHFVAATVKVFQSTIAQVDRTGAADGSGRVSNVYVDSTASAESTSDSDQDYADRTA